MTEETLDTSGPRPAVRLKRHLPDPPSVVWQAITERGQLKSWFPCDVIVEGDRWQVGASITFVFPPEVTDLTLTGTVLAVDEPKLLSYSWGEDEILRFELSPLGDRLPHDRGRIGQVPLKADRGPRSRRVERFLGHAFLLRSRCSSSRSRLPAQSWR